MNKNLFAILPDLRGDKSARGNTQKIGREVCQEAHQQLQIIEGKQIQLRGFDNSWNGICGFS